MGLKVIVVDTKPTHSAQLEAALVDAGFQVLAVVRGYGDLFSRVQALEPEAIVIDADSPKRDTLEHLAGLGERYPKPMVMFAEHADPELTSAAAQAGVAAYVVDGVSPPLVRSLVDVAVLHFHDQQHLQAELHRTRQTLADRELIDRAKCLLMEREGLSERDAYGALRKLAMDRSQRIVSVARQVLKLAGGA